MKHFIVDSCVDCPFSTDGGITGTNPTCQASYDVEEDQELIYWDDITDVPDEDIHEDCPLKSGPITVLLDLMTKEDLQEIVDMYEIMLKNKQKIDEIHKKIHDGDSS